MKKVWLILLLFLSCKIFAQKFEGLALTPPMGWNSWNTFQTNINEQLVKDVADIIISSGMKDAGYTYVVLDDAWMANERDAKTGDLVADPKKFPRVVRGQKPVLVTRVQGDLSTRMRGFMLHGGWTI